MLQNFSLLLYPRARDSDDRPTGPVEINSRSATIEGSSKKLIREEGETQGSFERRVAGELPAIGLPRLAYLFPDDDFPPEAPPSVGEEPKPAESACGPGNPSGRMMRKFLPGPR